MTSLLTNINYQCWNSNGKSGFGKRFQQVPIALPLTTLDLPKMIPGDMFSLSETSTEREKEEYNLRDEFDLVWGATIEPTIPVDMFSLSETSTEREKDVYNLRDEFDLLSGAIIEPTPFREGTSLEASSSSSEKQGGISSRDSLFRPSLNFSRKEVQKKALCWSKSDEVSSQEQNRKRSPQPSASMRQSKRARINHVNEEQEHKSANPTQFREYQDAQWHQQFQALLEYQRQYGNCNVPHTYEANPALSRWVKRQRYQYRLKMEGKRTSMSPERQDKLQNVGFVWDPHASQWKIRQTELAEYKQKFGSCDVPCRYSPNPQLGMWVRSQRRECKLLRAGKMSRMTLERYQLLDQMGFVWDPRAAAMSSKVRAINQD